MQKRPSELSNSFGFVVIDKPAGVTSHDCVQKLRKYFGIKRIGHGGTLDPAVTGVLPIAIGSATRLLSYLPEEKIYKGTIKLGTNTDTDDLQGQIIEQKHWPNLNTKELDEYLDIFRGEILQRPPLISSVHYKGERAYKRVRRGEKIVLEERKAYIYNLELLRWNQAKGEIDIKVNCSRGTYIRSIARDLGEAIGCGGCLAMLRRTKSMGFDESQSVQLTNELYKYENYLQVISPLDALKHLPRITLKTENEILHWRTGRQVITSADRFKSPPIKRNSLAKEENCFAIILKDTEEVIGIGEYIDRSLIIPKIVFNAI